MKICEQQVLTMTTPSLQLGQLPGAATGLLSSRQRHPTFGMQPSPVRVVMHCVNWHAAKRQRAPGCQARSAHKLTRRFRTKEPARQHSNFPGEYTQQGLSAGQVPGHVSVSSARAASDSKVDRSKRIVIPKPRGFYMDSGMHQEGQSCQRPVAS